MTQLAYHFREAVQLGEIEKAIDYSIRAGNAAFTVFAFEEAGAYWRTALELVDEEGGGERSVRARILWLLGDDIVSGGPKAVEYLEAAAPLFEELGDGEATTDVHARLGLYLSSSNIVAMDMRRAMEHFKKAEAQIAGLPESRRHGTFYVNLAAACLWPKRLADGLAAAKRAIEMGEDLNDDWLLANGELLSSVFLISSGSVTEGLRLAKQARQRAEPINHTVLGSSVAWVGGGNYRILGDPREAQDWYTSELAKPRTAQSAVRRAILLAELTGACSETGELTKARSYLAEAAAENTHPWLFFWEGEWARAEKMLTEWSEQSLATGNLMEDLFSAVMLAILCRFKGERARALQFLQRALNISVETGDILWELVARSRLATIAADGGDADEAFPHLRRCRQIVSAGEDWRARAAEVELAEAAIAAARGDFRGADGHFERAIAKFQHYCLPWEEANVLQHWGRALLAAGKRARAIEKFDTAIEIYQSRGAGTRFIEYVMADKLRTQGSMSSQRLHPLRPRLKTSG